MKRLSALIFPFATAALLGLAGLACAQTEPPVVYVTATPAPLLPTLLPGVPTLEATLPNPFRPTLTPLGPTATPLQPTPNPAVERQGSIVQHTIAAGDTLSALAYLYGASVDEITALNPGMTAESVLVAGQSLNVPGTPQFFTPDQKLIPDSELVNSPAMRGFDVEAYIKFQPGFIRVYSENVMGQRWMSGAEIIMFHATAASINPRLLLALLEYRGGWVTNPVPGPDQMLFPMGRRAANASGLFDQVAWAVNQLNEGYYGWRTRGLTTLELPDGSRLAYAQGLNGGSVGVQYFLARTAPDRATWERDVSQQGFLTTYMALFGDPFRNAYEPLVPADLTQPDWTLPFAQNQTWYITSGPHGGWDASASGWASVDFAPPDPPTELVVAQGQCYVSPFYATAMAPGLVVRSGDGVVALDLDMDGDERTGWVLTYLHIADEDRVPAGTMLQTGSAVGHPSCAGFYLNSFGTHVHIARKYNGEWIVADCPACRPDVPNVPFVMGGWELKGYVGEVWQGWLQKGDDVRRANAGREDPTNRISW